ncbi:MAG: bifunctional 5,10-methylenetetrahydrofolate dehydrogenase/5,10-methenyltetrahydrofolate cyclohydrolase [Candidatus Dormibacteria bacterium]
MRRGDRAVTARGSVLTARILDGRALAATVHDEVAALTSRLRHDGMAEPGLDVILCGDDPASATYVRGKGRIAERVGVRFTLHRPASDSNTADILRLLAELNADDRVDGILVQLPLPAQIDQDAVIEAVDPIKDADGFHPLNMGRLAAGRQVVAPPCTPAGVVELIVRSGVTIRGGRAVVIGRSTIVGRPLAIMLTNGDATVTLCHSRTAGLPEVASEADILVSAVGRPGMVDASYVREGACVIDVGTTPRDGRVLGDIDRAAVEPRAGCLTPVPGGVGPMTIAMLMRNTVALARARR